MASSAFLPFPQQQQPVASGSGVKPKRKRCASPDLDDDEMSYDRDAEATPKQLRIQPPSFEPGSAGFAFPPDLVPDMCTSATASESDQMDFDIESVADQQDDRYESYAYEGGSGGFCFGPGAEEDEMDSDDGSLGKGYFGNTNGSSHIHQIGPYTPFASSSAPQTPAPHGLMGPATAAPLSEDASAVERARNSHGPNCKSIPKLHMAEHADPATGQRSLWAICPDCGACERQS